MEEFCKDMKKINDTLENIVKKSYMEFPDSESKELAPFMSNLEESVMKIVMWIAKKKDVNVEPNILFHDEINHILEVGYKWK